MTRRPRQSNIDFVDGIVQIDNRWAQSQYLQFHDEGPVKPGAKTRKYTVYGRVNKLILGYIKWFPKWRQYTYYPNPDTVYNPGCLDDLAEYCEYLTSAHKGVLMERNRKKNMLARRQRRIAQLAAKRNL